MRYAILSLTLVLAGLTGCASATKPAEAPKKAVAKVREEPKLFPTEGLEKIEVAPEHVLGREFLPGGNVASYKAEGKGQPYQIFAIRNASPDGAALLLLDYKKKMTNAKFVAHFGGYAGTDGGATVFVFTKFRYLVGVVGLPEAEADMKAREIAARIGDK